MITSLNDLLNTLLSVRTTIRENDLIATANIAVAKVLSADPKRMTFEIVNLSANAMYVAPSNTVSTNKGIYIAPNGGSLSLNYINDLSLVTMDWYITASVDASAIYVLETIIY
jgi:hypothetical protein